MIKADKRQKQRIAILVKGDRELKKLLVQEATGDVAKTSTNDLTHTQANAILQKFNQKPVLYDNWAIFNNHNRSHKYILSLAIQYGWSIQHDIHGEIADLLKISEWLKSKKSPVSKPLMDMNTKELSKTISALEQMVSKKHAK